MSLNNDLYTPKKKVMPEVPGVRLVQHNYHDIGLLDGSFADKLYISVAEQIDDAIVAECVKIAHGAGIGQHILLNKKFITDAIREKLEAQQMINDARPVDAEVVRHGRWIADAYSIASGIDEYDEEFYVVCSECGRTEHADGYDDASAIKFAVKEYPYCHCGARMDGGA